MDLVSSTSLLLAFNLMLNKNFLNLKKSCSTEGAKGLASEIQSIKAEIEQEKIKINEQQVLDEIDLLDETASQYFESLDDCDAKHKEMQRATEGWICQALNFKQVEHPTISGLMRYQPSQKTLIPSNDLRTRLIPYCQQYGSYNRRVAHQNSDVALYRIGEGLIDALGSYIRWDDGVKLLHCGDMMKVGMLRKVRSGLDCNLTILSRLICSLLSKFCSPKYRKLQLESFAETRRCSCLFLLLKRCL